MFLAVSGSGEIRYKGKAALIPFRCLRASGAIPPGYKLEVCNLSAAEPFSVLLIGGPLGRATSTFGRKRPQVIEWGQRLPNLAPFGHAEAVVTCLLLGEERT
jgi:hypothetical protein